MTALGTPPTRLRRIGAALRRRLASERAIALPATISGLAIVSGLVAAVAGTSVYLSDASNTDRDQKRALAAAEAGLRAATFRTSKTNPESTQCMTDRPVSPDGAGECPGFAEELGNGARYTYYVTPALAPSGSCAGLPVSTTGVVQRCITSVGEANGVKRRVQIRTAAYDTAALFPVPGLTGLSSVDFRNSASVNASTGSNGAVVLHNSVNVTGNVVLGPSAPNPEYKNSSTSGPVLRRSAAEGNLILPPVDPGNSATCNDDARIVTRRSDPAPASPFCGSVSGSPGSDRWDQGTNVSYDTDSRELTLNNSASLTLNGGTYNFCDVHLKNSAQIIIPNGVRTRIFIDSPERPGSGCTSQGTLTMDNGTAFVTQSGDPLDLQIYVYGSSGSGEEVRLKNSGTLIAALYAPQSPVIFDNSVTVIGGIAGELIDFKNSVDFTWDSALSELRARVVSIYYRTGWRECRREPTTPSDPESGC